MKNHTSGCWCILLFICILISFYGINSDDSKTVESSQTKSINNIQHPHPHHHHHHHRSHPDQLYSQDHSLLNQFNGTSTHTTYCPSSTLINFDVSGYFNYPLTFFESRDKHRSITNSDIHHKSPLFNCTTHRPAILTCDGQPCHTAEEKCSSPSNNECFHICSPQVQLECPVFPEALDAAFERSSSWVYNTTKSTHTLPLLFHIRQVLSDPLETVRVVVFGGSAALGAEAGGCFCDLDYDSKCVAFNHTNYKTRHTPNFGNDRDCRWLNYFVTWLRSISAARVKTVEFVQGGSYPDYGARKYVELSSGEVTYTAPFTKNDIVFIDYSMNEARYFTQKERLHDQQSRLEFLIRTIYDNTSQNSTGWPVIIQTETWPYPCGFCWKETHHMDYASVYTKVMSHYKLPIFSYKDFIWSDHLKTNHPDLQRALAYKESHPLWPHHIYFADIYAGLFSRELKRAYRFHESMMHANHSGDIHAYKKHNDIIQTQSKPPPPRPLSTFEIVDYCSKQTKPILDLDASDYIQNSDSSLQRSGRIVGSYAVVIPPYNHADVVKTNPDSSVGWNIIDDKKGRYGWIDEFPDMTRSKPSSPTLLFFANNTWESMMASGGQMLVSIQYLRTYLNAGRVKVYVCGQSSDEPFGVIDALWEYPLRQVSIPQYFMKSFRPEDLNKSKCLAFLQKYHSFTSISPVSSSNSGDTKPFILSENNSNLEPVPSIIIEHEVITRFHHRGFFEQTSRTYKQKVKISSIQLCKKDE